MAGNVRSGFWRFGGGTALVVTACSVTGCSIVGWTTEDSGSEPSATGDGTSGSSGEGTPASGGASGGGAAGGGAPRSGAPSLEGEGPARGGIDNPTVVVHAGQNPPHSTLYEPDCPANGVAPPLTAPDCPATPAVRDCKNEGQVCLYPGSNASCVDRWECRFGIWSPAGEQCPTGNTLAEGEDEACPESEPLDLAPCDVVGVQCAYAPCFGIPTGHAECSCGRWHVTHNGCPTVP